MNLSELGFFRIAAVSPKIELGQPLVNAQRLVEAFQEAESQAADLAWTPELALTGYTCEDWFHTEALIQETETALTKICEFSKSLDLFLTVGAPVRLWDGRLFNTQVCIQNGLVLGIVPKSYLPNSGEFYERRWFQPGLNLQIKVKPKFAESEIVFGQQIFHFTGSGTDAWVGIEICHDLWASISPSQSLALSGANLILNASASNEAVGKTQFRRELVRQQSSRLVCAYAYLGSGISESSKDTVFGGHQVVFENGALIHEVIPFSKASNQSVTCMDIDLQAIAHARSREPTFGESVMEAKQKLHIVECARRSHTSDLIFRNIDPDPFVTAIRSHPHEAIAIAANGLARRARSIQAKTLIVGISGGLDSTLAFHVAIEAQKISGSGKVIGVTMPGPGTSDKTLSLARALIHELHVESREVNINAAVDLHLEDLGKEGDKSSVVFENAQARERTQILFDIANAEGGLVVGTGDLSELALGWCTFNADHMSHYNVNVGIPKTAVRELIMQWSHHAQAPLKKILSEILSLPISPELLPLDIKGEIAQYTEKVLGSYEIHDFILYEFLRKGSTPEKIAFLAHTAFHGKKSADEIDHALSVFSKRFQSQQFKRTTLPPGPKIFDVSLSPRADWRSPDEVNRKI